MDRQRFSVRSSLAGCPLRVAHRFPHLSQDVHELLLARWPLPAWPESPAGGDLLDTRSGQLSLRTKPPRQYLVPRRCPLAARLHRLTVITRAHSQASWSYQDCHRQELHSWSKVRGAHRKDHVDTSSSYLRRRRGVLPEEQAVRSVGALRLASGGCAASAWARTPTPNAGRPSWAPRWKSAPNIRNERFLFWI